LHQKHLKSSLGVLGFRHAQGFEGSSPAFGGGESLNPAEPLCNASRARRIAFLMKHLDEEGLKRDTPTSIKTVANPAITSFYPMAIFWCTTTSANRASIGEVTNTAATKRCRYLPARTQALLLTWTRMQNGYTIRISITAATI
jgi:hypothetical protein